MIAPIFIRAVDVGLRVVDRVLEHVPPPDPALRRQREDHRHTRRMERLRLRQERWRARLDKRRASG